MTGYIAIIAVVLIGVSSAFGYWQYNRASDLLEDNAKLVSEVEKANAATQAAYDTIEEANDMIEDMTRDLKEQREDIREVEDRAAKIAKERDDVVNRYNSYRSTIKDRALAKPGLLGNAATRATKRVFDSVGDATTIAPRPRVEEGGEGSVPPTPTDDGERKPTDDRDPDAGDDEGPKPAG